MMPSVWKVTVEPVSEPVSLAEGRLWLKAPSGDTTDDAIVTELIKASRKHVERYTGISLLTQTVQENWDSFPLETDRETPNGELRLSVSPLISVSSVSYLDGDGNSQTVTSTNYVVDNVSKPARIAPTFNFVWPETYDVINAITVTYTTGFSATSAAGFPTELVTAMKLWMAGLYDTRQDYAKRYKDASMFLMDTVKVRYY